MDITYPYSKQRKNFGKQPMFCETHVEMLDTIDPNKEEQKAYILRNPVHQMSQVSTSISEHDINTKRVVLENRGTWHAEGGWPKDVVHNDEELTNRYRRRFERDDSYVNAVLDTYPKFNYFINQNNAIEMYQMYFKHMSPQQPVEKSSMRLVNAYRDPFGRPIASLDWTAEEDAKLVVAYCNKKYPITCPVNKSLHCYVWDLENSNRPAQKIIPPSACWQVVCSPDRPWIIVGGLEDGTVCIFDVRAKDTPISKSPLHLAHRDPVCALEYINYRKNTEFFCGSSDGQCLWWDVRNMSQPTDRLIMSVRISPGDQVSLANAEGVSSLKFEKTFPTRFLCGTDTGFVINVNRKGKSHQDMMSSVFNAHFGPVKAVQRSPCTSKMFITCGDWAVHIWSDDAISSPIITGMPHRYQITDVAWAPQRLSSYMSVCIDGKFRYWDLLRKVNSPIMTMSLTSKKLLKVKPHDEGKFIAIGDSNGIVYLITMSENLYISGPRDKVFMSQIYEREFKREHILEARVREIRLKLKEEETTEATQTEEFDPEVLVKEAEDDYKKMVVDEIRRLGVTTSTGGKADRMRKR